MNKTVPKLDFSKYKTAGRAAKALAKHIEEVIGTKHVYVKKPSEARDFFEYAGEAWMVIAEEAPFQWAISPETSIPGLTGVYDNDHLWLEATNNFTVQVYKHTEV